MNAWVIAVWVIAAVMGCWSFSLLVRTISELLARKRVHLTARRSIRSLMLGGCLSLVCGVVSLASGIAAIYLERQFTASGNRWTTPLLVIGASVCLFAFLLLIWAIIGDRSRGRKRCPKCWYDMSASPSLQCPECGKSAKSERKLSKARRPRWAFVLAVLMVVPSIYAMMVSKRVAEYGAFAAVPTWFLMAGWEHLPDGWIYDNGFGTQEYCLEDRLSEWDTPRWMLQAFAHRLSKPLITDRQARWDTRRITLLDELSWYYFDEQREPEIPQEPNEIPIDLDKLIQLSAGDVLDAVYSSPTVPIDPFQYYGLADDPSCYEIARSLIIQQEELRSGTELDGDEGIVHERLRNALESHKLRLEGEPFGRMIISAEVFPSYMLSYLAWDSRCYFAQRDVLLSTDRDPLLDDLSNRAIHLGLASQYMTADQRGKLFERAAQMIENPSLDHRHIGLNLLYVLQRINKLDDRTEVPEHHAAVQAALRNTLDDHRFIVQRPYHINSIHYLTLQSIAFYSSTGSLSFPLIREELLITGDAPGIDPKQSRLGEISAETIDPQIWLEHFSDFFESNDPEILEWLGWNIPGRVCSPEDATFDALALLLAIDSDVDIADAGWYALERRDALHLLPEESADD
jgi:hypothetical protein